MKILTSIFSFLLVSLIIGLTTGFILKPQEPVTVVVMDSNGDPVSGATVRLCNSSIDYSEVSVSGVAYFSDVAAGAYCLDANTGSLMGRDDEVIVGKAGGGLEIYVFSSEIPLCSDCP